MADNSLFATLIDTCNENIRRARQNLAEFCSHGAQLDLDRVVSNLHAAKQQHESDISRLRTQIVSAQQSLFSERTTSQRLQQELAAREMTIMLRDSTIRSHLAETVQLRRLHAETINDSIKQNHQTLRDTELRSYHEGLANGTWLSDIILTGISPASPRLLPSSFKQAILRVDIVAVRNLILSDRTVARSPALHYAALIGNIEIAELLRLDINGQCTMGSDDGPGGTVYGVTPMHLAIGARQDSMIRYLRAQGASFEMPQGPQGKRTTAPATWLANERWLGRSGELNDVVGILRTLKELGWDVFAPVNKEKETLQDLVYEKLRGRPELRNAILVELRR